MDVERLLSGCCQEQGHECKCKDKCAVPQKVIYIIFTDKTCIDKVCVSRCCGLSKAEQRMLWKLWWLRKQQAQKHCERPEPPQCPCQAPQGKRPRWPRR